MSTANNYLLFLKQYSESDGVFLILTAYRLDGGTVAALDLAGPFVRLDRSTVADLLGALSERLQ